MRADKLCVPRVERGICMPGVLRLGDANWCPGESRWWGCNSYPADRLDQMLRVNERLQKYNEIVLDVQALVKQWPVGIEAVVFIKDSLNWPPSVASDVHRRLLVEYGAKAATIPLLQLKLTGEEVLNHHSPFPIDPRRDIRSLAFEERYMEASGWYESSRYSLVSMPLVAC